MKIIWSPLAIDRVAEIANYIAKDKPTAAENWVDKIFSKVESLASSPKSGSIVPEINKDQYREIIYGNYRIVYRIEEKRISILTVRHGKQLLPIEEILA
nr:type II toxin-antitoxin system RelE/ParE family toxin [uncultured Desulfobacter sp.]